MTPGAARTATRKLPSREDRTVVRSVSAMGTVVTIQVHGAQAKTPSSNKSDAIDRALGWFRHVEDVCSRFDPESEVSRLSQCAGTAVAVSPALFHATEVALAVAAASGGAFDP